MDEALDDTTWKALSDPTRRALLDLVRAGPRTTGQLAEAVPELSRFAVMKHLGVLEAAGLIVVRREGRKRWNHLNAVPLRRIYERWVSRYEDMWAGSLLGLKRLAEGRVVELVTDGSDCLELSVDLDAEPDRIFEMLLTSPAVWNAGTSIEWRIGGAVTRGGCVAAHVAVLRPPQRLVVAGPMDTDGWCVVKVDVEAADSGAVLRLAHCFSEVNHVVIEQFAEAWREGLAALQDLIATDGGGS